MAVQLHTHFHPHPHPDDDDDDDDDFLSELTHHMARFLLPDDDSPIASRSHHLQSPWDSPEGSASASSQEPSSPATTPEELSSKSSLDLLLIQNTKLNERRNSNSDSDSDSKHVLGHEIDHALYSYESLIQEQIRAIEGKGAPRRTRRPRPPRPGPHQDIRALFLHGPAASRGGTGVFLPRAAGGGATTPSESTNKQGKGCATVLIPARVVQALQLHFDQMAATSSGPKSAGFPPLHDVLVSNRDGMYSLQKRQSKKAPASIQHDTILPQEWTY